MNQLEVALEPDYGELKNGKLYLKVKLTIDGLCPLQCNEDDFDIGELIGSIKQDGDYFIWTCSCGVAGCAGYYNGIRVTNGNDVTVWEDRDLDKRYVFETTTLKNKLQVLYDDVLKWNLRASSAKTELRICPSWTMEYLLPAIGLCASSRSVFNR